MQIYWVGDRYVRTASEATKLGFGEVTEFPTDKDGLIDALNKLHQEKIHAVAAVQPVETSPAPTEPEAPEEPVRSSGRKMDAISVLSRLDSPGVDVEGVVEAIAKASGYALKRYAGAVAVRFHELEK